MKTANTRQDRFCSWVNAGAPTYLLTVLIDGARRSAQGRDDPLNGPASRHLCVTFSARLPQTGNPTDACFRADAVHFGDTSGQPRLRSSRPTQAHLQTLPIGATGLEPATRRGRAFEHRAD